MREKLKVKSAKFKVFFVALCPCAFVLCFSMLLSACGRLVPPATTPPQLHFTPGAPVAVTDRLYETSAFTVRYPTGWRVVTAAANQPISVVFVAPDEVSTITLQVGELNNATFDPKFKTDVRDIHLANGTLITAIGRAPADSWETFAPVFEAVVASVK
jgi:hypothetical protein